MYGKHYAVMYCGSMVGAGFGAFSVMGYVIANMKPDRVVGFQVELNTKILSAVFGEKEDEIQKAIDYLCAPDEHTRTPGDDGRRLVKVGTFSYRVVNGAHYDRIRNEEDRREQNRQAQIRHREKKKPRRKTEDMPSSGAYKAAEKEAVEALESGDVKKFEEIAAR